MPSAGKYCWPLWAGCLLAGTCVQTPLAILAENVSSLGQNDSLGNGSYDLVKASNRDPAAEALFAACSWESASLCRSVLNDGSRSFSCLWENQFSGNFSQGCRVQMYELLDGKEALWYFKRHVALLCATEITAFCEIAQEEEHRLKLEEFLGTSWRDSKPGTTLYCLQKHDRELPESACVAEVQRISAMQLQESLAEKAFHRSCRADVAAFCPQSPAADLRMCMQRHISSLSQSCMWAHTLGHIRTEHADDERVMHPSISRICAPEITGLCGSTDKDKNRTVSCLLAPEQQDKLSPSCSQALLADVEAQHFDLQLKLGIPQTCIEDASAHCATEYAVGAGTIRPCLLHNTTSLRSDKCWADLHDNLVLQHVDACVADAGLLCSTSSFLLECLLRNSRHLSSDCRDVLALPPVEENSKMMPSSERSDADLAGNLSLVCGEDAAELCQIQNTSNASVVTPSDLHCLLQYRYKVRPPCSVLLLRLAVENVEAVQRQPEVSSSCDHDVAYFCEVWQGADDALLHACLQSFLTQLSLSCRLSEQDVMHSVAEDHLVNPVMKGTCLDAKVKLCPDVDPSYTSAVSCLLEHMHSHDMTRNCFAVLEIEQAKRAANIVYDGLLEAVCAESMHTLMESKLCANISTDDRREAYTRGYDKVVCLLRNRNAIDDAGCQDVITQEILSEHDAYAAKPVAPTFCQTDAKKFCRNVQPGLKNMLACLLEHRVQLSENCLDDALQMQAEEAEYGNGMTSPKMRSMCPQEVKDYCPSEVTDELLLRCLRMYEDEDGFSDKCRIALKKAAESVKQLKKKEEELLAEPTLEEFVQFWYEDSRHASGWGLVQLSIAAATLLLMFVVSLVGLVLLVLRTRGILVWIMELIWGPDPLGDGGSKRRRKGTTLPATEEQQNEEDAELLRPPPASAAASEVESPSP